MTRIITLGLIQCKSHWSLRRRISSLMKLCLNLWFRILFMPHGFVETPWFLHGFNVPSMNPFPNPCYGLTMLLAFGKKCKLGFHMVISYTSQTFKRIFTSFTKVLLMSLTILISWRSCGMSLKTIVQSLVTHVLFHVLVMSLH